MISHTQTSKSSSTSSPVETLVPIDEEERWAPNFERTVDLLATAAPHNIAIDQTEVFEQLVCAYDDKNGIHSLSALPARVRRKICGFCFDSSELRKISLSPKFAVKAVFPDGHFACPWDVLDPVWGGLQAFRALRHDLMTYFWTTYHFHVTLNVFSGSVFSPLSHLWLLGSLDRVQWLTIEVDLTRFSGSSLKIATAFGTDHDKVEHLLNELIQGLLQRRGKITIAELNLMCRRYEGFRPLPEGIGNSKLKFCPDDAVRLCAAMCELRGMLQRCRISGFTLEYTKEMFAAAFAVEDQPLELIVPVNSAWPPVPLPDTPEPFYVSNMPRILGASSSETGLQHSQSFAEEFEKELENRYSLLSDLTTTSSQDRGLEEDDTLTNDDFQSSSGDLPEPEGQLTPRFRHIGTYRILCTRTFEVSEGTRTPSPEMFPTPESAIALNNLNERDPAFHRTWNAIRTQTQLEENEQDVRTLQAMRSNSQTDTPAIANENMHLNFAASSTITTIESPAERCDTSTTSRANETGGNSRRRYFAFVDRLRGRASI